MIEVKKLMLVAHSSTQTSFLCWLCDPITPPDFFLYSCHNCYICYSFYFPLNINTLFCLLKQVMLLWSRDQKSLHVKTCSLKIFYLYIIHFFSKSFLRLSRGGRMWWLNMPRRFCLCTKPTWTAHCRSSLLTPGTVSRYSNSLTTPCELTVSLKLSIQNELFYVDPVLEPTLTLSCRFMLV